MWRVERIPDGILPTLRSEDAERSRSGGIDMYLTPDNAPNLLGKTLDATKHILGAYPYKVIQFPDGMYATVDRAGVCSPVSNDQFNQVWFDMIDGQYVEG